MSITSRDSAPIRPSRTFCECDRFKVPFPIRLVSSRSGFLSFHPSSTIILLHHHRPQHHSSSPGDSLHSPPHVGLLLPRIAPPVTLTALTPAAFSRQPDPPQGCSSISVRWITIIDLHHQLHSRLLHCSDPSERPSHQPSLATFVAEHRPPPIESLRDQAFADRSCAS